MILHTFARLVLSGFLTFMLALASAAQEGSLVWAPNPYPLLDESLIATQSNLTRQVVQPQKWPDPIVDGEAGRGDKNFQPYLTVLRDPATGRFRIWYNARESPSNIGYLESEDGINWIRPHQALTSPTPVFFGASVIDRGPAYSDPNARFILGYCHFDKQPQPWKGTGLDPYEKQRQVAGFHALDEDRGGLYLATSPDGLNWTRFANEPSVPHTHDINSIHWDPLRRRFIALVSMAATGDTWPDARRIPFATVSEDLRQWREPWMAIKPEPGESGETQFYCMDGLLARGELLIGLVRVLRDDLNGEPDKTAAEMGDQKRKFSGVGYTVVAWSRDGETWRRELAPFIDRGQRADAWDRAIAWGSCQVPVGEELFIYYGGYKRGHKVEPASERQIGLARMPLDRYVGYAADQAEGGLRTETRNLDADRMLVNARVYGALRVRVLDEGAQPVPGFDWTDAQPLVGDSIRFQVQWKRPLSELKGEKVAFEFTLVNGELFGFELM